MRAAHGARVSGGFARFATVEDIAAARSTSSSSSGRGSTAPPQPPPLPGGVALQTVAEAAPAVSDSSASRDVSSPRVRAASIGTDDADTVDTADTLPAGDAWLASAGARGALDAYAATARAAAAVGVAGSDSEGSGFALDPRFAPSLRRAGEDTDDTEAFSSDASDGGEVPEAGAGVGGYGWGPEELERRFETPRNRRATRETASSAAKQRGPGARRRTPERSPRASVAADDDAKENDPTLSPTSNAPSDRELADRLREKIAKLREEERTSDAAAAAAAAAAEIRVVASSADEADEDASAGRAAASASASVAAGPLGASNDETSIDTLPGPGKWLLRAESAATATASESESLPDADAYARRVAAAPDPFGDRLRARGDAALRPSTRTSAAASTDGESLDTLPGADEFVREFQARGRRARGRGGVRAAGRGGGGGGREGPGGGG